MIKIEKSENTISIKGHADYIQRGLSKSYLYQTPEIRKRIEECRQTEHAKKMAWHEKYDKTSKSKDVIIAAKDKRIAKLEEENTLAPVTAYYGSISVRKESSEE